jgi:hypothetical protein
MFSDRVFRCLILIALSCCQQNANGAVYLSEVALNPNPNPKIPPYFAIQSIKVRQIRGSKVDNKSQLDADTLPQPLPTPLPTAGGGGGSDLFPGLDIVGVGQDIWSIITANEPTVDANINNYSALPKGKSADDLERWSDPKTADFNIVYTNKLGMDVVGFDYTISFQYGGSLRGVGKYVTGATIIPSNITAKWGYKVDAEVQNFPPTNVGTTVDPVAMIQMAMKWTVTSTFEKQQQGTTYTLDGTGRIIEKP